MADDKKQGKSRKRKTTNEKNTSLQSTQWTYDEKQKFVSALCKGPPYRHENGSINWMQLKRFIGTKTLQEVKHFAKTFHAMEHGIAYEEFSTRAAIDVWRQLAEKSKGEGDNMADVCIPQALTVAALEPINASPMGEGSSTSAASSSAPSYRNIYTYLSAITRGAEGPVLNSSESAIVLSMLEDLILTLSKSQTLIQREFLHSSYPELRSILQTQEGQEANSRNVNFNSINPFGVPFDILDFQLLEQCMEKGNTAAVDSESAIEKRPASRQSKRKTKANDSDAQKSLVQTRSKRKSSEEKDTDNGV